MALTKSLHTVTVLVAVGAHLKGETSLDCDLAIRTAMVMLGLHSEPNDPTFMQAVRKLDKLSLTNLKGV